jgi:hypothetical protein
VLLLLVVLVVVSLDVVVEVPPVLGVCVLLRLQAPKTSAKQTITLSKSTASHFRMIAPPHFN